MTFTRSRLASTLHRATGFLGRRPATTKRARKNVSKAALMWAARKRDSFAGLRSDGARQRQRRN